MTDELTIEFFFDVSSPYSYLASTQIDQLEADTGLPVRWRPFLLGGVFKATGNSPPARVPPKASYMLQDLHRWADHYEIPFEMPADFPLNSLTTQRALVATAERDSEAVAPLASRLFRAYWADGRDASDPEVVEQIADDLELPAADIVAAADEDDIKDRLRAITDEAVERGAFGAPTFFVGDEMFWGNDRLQFVREAAERKTSG